VESSLAAGYVIGVASALQLMQMLRHAREH